MDVSLSRYGVLMSKGIERIYYSTNGEGYDQYNIRIGDKWLRLPVVGSINATNEVRLCKILQDLIDSENKNDQSS
jgi:hypothetical protein